MQPNFVSLLPRHYSSNKNETNIDKALRLNKQVTHNKDLKAKGTIDIVEGEELDKQTLRNLLVLHPQLHKQRQPLLSG